MNKKLKRKQALIMSEPYRTPFNSKVAKVSGDVIEDSVGEIKYATSFDGATKIVDANKNLLILPDTEETTQAGVTYSIKDGVITLNGTTTDIFNLKLENVVKVEENQTYYLYQKTENTTATLSLVSNIGNYDEEPTFFQYNNKSKKMTKTGYLTLHLYITNTTTFTNAKFYVMLVLGTTAPTEFEPNFKNLLDLSQISNIETFSTKDNQTITCIKRGNGAFFIKDYPLENGTYEVSLILKTKLTLSRSFYYIVSDSNPTGQSLFSNFQNLSLNEIHSKQIQITENKLSIRLWSVSGYQEFDFQMMIVKSSIIPSQFIPFANPYFVSLGQNGSVQYNGLEPREIDLKGNVISKINNQVSDKLSNYALTKNTKVVDLGSLTWGDASTVTSDIIRFAAADLKDLIAMPNTSTDQGNLLCTMYTTVSHYATYIKEKGIAISPTGILTIYDPDYNTSDKLEAFKKAIRGTLLMYQTKNPTTINTTSFKTFKEDANATISDDNFTSSPNAITETFKPTRSYDFKVNGFSNVVKSSNFIRLDNQNLELSGIKVQIKDGVITVNGVSSERNVSAEINLKDSIGSGTYSFNAFTTVGSRIDVYMNAPLVSLADLSINTTKTNVSLTSATQLILYFPKGIQYDNRVLKPMLIEGNTAPTEYEPYYSFTKELLIKQPLRKFDYLTYDGVYRQTNEIVLDGSWNVVENNYLFKNGWFVVANVDNCFPARSDWGEPFSKLYSVTTSDLPLISFYEMVDGGNKKGIAIENAKIRIHLDDSADNSLNNWTVEKVNNYFKQNPITITYKTVDQTFEATSLTRLLFKNGYNKITAFDSINNNAIVEYLEYYKSKGD